MKRSWWSAEAPTMVAASDVASEIVWNFDAGVAVFDQSGRLAYSNPAFRQSPALSDLVDSRGYITSADLESARRQVVHHGVGGGSRSTSSKTAERTLDFEVLPLKVAPEWTAMVLRARPLAAHHADSLAIGLLVHELREPLLLAHESLEALTQLAQTSDTSIRDAVTRQGRSLARLTALVQGLRDLSLAHGLESSRSSWTSVNLRARVADVATRYHDLAATRGLGFEVTVESDVPAIEGHGELLTRAIVNLVDNALKYASAPGPVRLSLRRRGALAVVEVADCGPGIAGPDQAAIFTEFYRLPAARASSTPGTGLGLAVARRVAEAHGGRLSLESRAGVGSIFRLCFLLGRSVPPGFGAEPRDGVPDSSRQERGISDQEGERGPNGTLRELRSPG
jgi:signal transduction histidine kinase